MLDLSSFRVDASSYVDPHGRLGWIGETPVRRIEGSSAPFYQDLFKRDLVDELVRSYGLVESRPLAAAGEEALFIEHVRVWPTTYCVEWPPSMMRDAALVTLDLAIRLLDEDIALQDGSPWNVLFDGAHPVFVDFTSIVPQEGSLIWQAYGQFLSLFLNPLLLASAGRGRLARLLLQDNVNGVGERELADAAPLSLKLRRPSIPLSGFLKSQLDRRPELRSRLRRASQSNAVAPDIKTRKHFFAGLRRRIERLRFPSVGDVWEIYYESIPATVDRGAKLGSVEAMLRKLGPSTVVDLGANTGPFSVLAAQVGAKVISIDSDEGCMDALYRTVKRENLAVTPVISDLLSPTPSLGYLSEQFPPLLKRARSEVALCLGLMHHLHVAGRQSFEHIAALVDQVASKAAIFEYVDMADANNDWIAAGRNISYSSDDVLAALREKFSRIERLPSDRPTRELWICER